MSVYIKLGKGAVWLELRKEWLRQRFRVERHKKEVVITCPWLLLILTPPL